MTLQEIALLVVSLPLYGAGYVAGVVVRVTLWIVAAIVAGYKAAMTA